MGSASQERAGQETAPSPEGKEIGVLFEDGTLFKTLLDNLHEGVYFVDTKRRILYWNQGAERISGYSSEEVIGRSCKDNLLMHVDEKGTQLCLHGCPLSACMADGEYREARVYLHHKEGHRIPVQVAVSVVKDEEGRVVGGLETFFDASKTIAALEEIDRLREMALICPLTGIGNRRYTENILAQRLNEMEREESWLAVLFFDIDRFKVFNDTYGHASGDTVLRMTARTLAGAMRSYDFLGRWGGEEFVAVCSNMPPNKVKKMAERLRALVEHSGRTLSTEELKVTVSIGAYMCRPGDTMDSAIQAADKLMYESKSNGRNRVTMDPEAGSLKKG